MPWCFFLPAFLLQYQLTNRVYYRNGIKAWFNNEGSKKYIYVLFYSDSQGFLSQLFDNHGSQLNDDKSGKHYL